jgi:hypothetical protein
MATLRKSGRSLIPAWLIAMTKGEAATPLPLNKFSLKGDIRLPINATEIRENTETRMGIRKMAEQRRTAGTWILPPGSR